MIKIDRKNISIAAISLAFVFLVAAFVAARPLASNTPLFTVRMEQASSKMNFLPTEMNSFTYTAENGYNLNLAVGRSCVAEQILHDTTPQNTCKITCIPTCPPNTEGGYTCANTSCQPTCASHWTCYLSTCTYTCNSTCTSPWTCYLSTCEPTCGYTCEPTCESDTCWETCIGPRCPVK